MNNTDQLTAIVQAGIDGGWLNEKGRLIKIRYIKTSPANKCKDIMLSFDHPEHKCICFYHYCFTDLIHNRPFMSAVYGEKDYWEETSDEYGLGTCYNTYLPAYIYHGMQATKIALSGEDAVKYLYDNLPNGDNKGGE